MEAVLKLACWPSRRPPIPPPPHTFFFLLLLAVTAFAGDSILPGEGIFGNQTMVSKNGVFELGFFSPGADIYHFLGVRLRAMPAGAASPTFWLGDRVYISDLPSASLELFGGRLYIREAGANLWWSSVAGGGDDDPPPAVAAAVLLDSGNLVVRDSQSNSSSSSRVLWQSFDCPGDALLPGARLGVDRDTGKNVSLRYTTSGHNASLSVDSSRRNGFVLTADGGRVDHLGTFPAWMVSSQDSGSALVLNPPEIPDATEHLQLHLGQVTLRRWSDPDGSWVSRWTFPPDCKSGAFFCGNFGACTSTGECECVDGFVPSKPSEWQLGYFVNGCTRSLPLTCGTNNGQPGQGHGDDSFVPLDKLQGLPYDPQDDAARSVEACREACAGKCYCVAYAYDHSGCKLWHHRLYNVSLAAGPPYTKVFVRLGSKSRAQKHLHTTFLVVGLAAVITCAILLLLVLLWSRTYRRGLWTCSRRAIQIPGSLAVYPYAQLKEATRDFSEKLGEGGFGSVFRGTITPGATPVAVKRLKGLAGHADKQFRAEVQTLGVIQHTNLVRLLGFCVKGNNNTQRLLVYEYMANGSLDWYLFSEQSGGLLNWELRHRIALGVAKGLAYLHEECETCIIHCDIKPENILLDAGFRAKIADFGMAKLLGREFDSVLTTMRGTLGYLAPEWIYGQRITTKADVYSFGILLLEIISGRRTTTRTKLGNHGYFPLYAAVQVNQGDVLCLLDDRLQGNADGEVLEVTCRVACWCIQDEEKDRPSMGLVVRMLEGVVATETPPIPSSLKNLSEDESSSSYWG